MIQRLTGKVMVVVNSRIYRENSGTVLRYCLLINTLSFFAFLRILGTLHGENTEMDILKKYN